MQALKPPADPSSLAAQISKKGLPPVHLWNPELCGDIDIRIARDGTWFYMGSPIGRKRLVRLFSTVLKKEDNEHYLVTPVEKLRIVVDDAPFVAVQLEDRIEDDQQVLYFRTNTDDIVAAGPQHSIWVDFAQDGEPSPYIHVRSGLCARLARSVYYQLVELGEEIEDGQGSLFGVWSRGEYFVLGTMT